MPTVPGNVADPANLVPQAASRTHEERIAEERMKNAVLIENPDGEIKFGSPTDDSTADSSPEDAPKNEDAAGPSGLHD